MFGFIARVFGFGSRPTVAPEVTDGRKDTLRVMLGNSQYTWRKLSTLAASIGASEGETEMLLYSIGARRSRDGQPLFRNA